ncbi:MAG: tagaturonate epimerase family protein [Ignavibacteriaceae bacterium]|nr:tagaturonate epimerase family protein [Ignavibacteriaceae bacterium]
MLLEKYSIGIGDRYGHQGVAQLKALVCAKNEGVSIVPVWNKSKREHSLIGSIPADARKEADNAVSELGWKDSYYIDADHIGIKTVDDFVKYCNFFTIDVADFIGEYPNEQSVKSFVKKASAYLGKIEIPGISGQFDITENKINTIAKKYLVAIKEAARIYQHLLSLKGADSFVTEVSLDENEQPQSPEELFFILLGLAAENINIQTIAPKFTGRFNKGIDYIGDTNVFINEFEDDICVIKYAIKEFSLSPNLKLSVHSGSDKFSLYKPIHDVLIKHDAGVHLKTAGTTWLEEVIGLAEAGGEGTKIAKEIYEQSFNRIDEMMKPYLTVVDIDFDKLPNPIEVYNWSGEKFAVTLRHDQSNPAFNIHFRQLVHIGFKVAAEMGERYTNALVKYENVIAKNVTENIYSRHIKPLFLGK